MDDPEDAAELLRRRCVLNALAENELHRSRQSLRITDRGFKHMPAIPSAYGGEIRAYESSAARAPHLWISATVPSDLNDPTSQTITAAVHLPLDEALRFAEQIQYLAEHHYQNGR